MESTFYSTLTSSSTNLKIPRSEALSFPDESFYAILYDRDARPFEDAYITNNFEVVKVVKVDRKGPNDDYAELKIKRAQFGSTAKAFTGSAHKYRIRIVEDVTKFNGAI